MNKIVKTFLYMILTLCVCVSVLENSAFEAFAQNIGNDGEYGVFIGADSEQLKKIDGYSMVVIDAWENSAEDVKLLHDKGCVVYSYINVGAIENWRNYYDEYKDLALGDYENWEDEKWVNVADVSWQKFVVEKLAAGILEKGADGFFVDNADVYYKYQNDDIYRGFVSIIKGLDASGKPVIINGGNDLVTRLIQENSAGIIKGVNQESVFSRIKNYKKNKFARQTKKERLFFQNYLMDCKNAGLDVYLIEYTKSKSLKRKISKYCKKMGYKYYISASLSLE